MSGPPGQASGSHPTKIRRMALKIYDRIVVGTLECNCYIVGDPLTKETIVIDPGDDVEKLSESLARNQLQVVAIVATHAHFDHIMGAERLKALTGASFYMHADDLRLLGWYGTSLQLFLGMPELEPPEVDGKVLDGDELQVGDHALGVIHTPGHSEGSISLLSDGACLFSGDTLFARSIGRSDLPGGDHGQLLSSIRERLLSLDDMPVYPGHGPPTTLDQERRFNPFLG